MENRDSRPAIVARLDGMLVGIVVAGSNEARRGHVDFYAGRLPLRLHWSWPDGASAPDTLAVSFGAQLLGALGDPSSLASTVVPRPDPQRRSVATPQPSGSESGGGAVTTALAVIGLVALALVSYRQLTLGESIADILPPDAVVVSAASSRHFDGFDRVLRVECRVRNTGGVGAVRVEAAMDRFEAATGRRSSVVTLAAGEERIVAIDFPEFNVGQVVSPACRIRP